MVVRGTGMRMLMIVLDLLGMIVVDLLLLRVLVLILMLHRRCLFVDAVLLWRMRGLLVHMCCRRRLVLVRWRMRHGPGRCLG